MGDLKLFVSLWSQFHKTFKREMILSLPNFEPFAAPSEMVVGDRRAKVGTGGQQYDLCLGAALSQNPGLTVIYGGFYLYRH